MSSWIYNPHPNPDPDRNAQRHYLPLVPIQIVDWGTVLKKTLKCDGSNFYTHTWDKSKEIGQACAVFYGSLDERMSAHTKAYEREEVHVHYGGGASQAYEAPNGGNSRTSTGSRSSRRWSSDAADDPSITTAAAGGLGDTVVGSAGAAGYDAGAGAGSDTMTSSGTPANRARGKLEEAKSIDGTLSGPTEGGVPVTMVESGDDFSPSGVALEDARSSSDLPIASRAGTADARPETTGTVPTSAASTNNSKSRPNTRPSHGKEQADEKARFMFMWHHDKVSQHAKALRCVDVMEETLSRVWLTCEQLALLVKVFECGKVKRTEKFGTYRCEIVIALFPRLLDIWNFEVINSELTGFEIGCLYARIGWLNLFNPMKPDGGWELDLGEWEQRIMAKMFCQLSVVEPGNSPTHPPPYPVTCTACPSSL